MGRNPAGAGLPANASCQSPNSVLIDRVRQQAGSYESASIQIQARAIDVVLTPLLCP
jgi:hypothetical protein